MNELRWILLGIGIAVIGAVWLVSQRKRPPAAGDGGNSIDVVHEPEPPELTDEVDMDIDPAELEEIGRALGNEIRGDRGKPAADDARRKLLVLHVARDETLDGNELLAALEAAGLQFGRMGIYHCIEDGCELFSVANMLEPGTFGTEATIGVTLFAVLGGEVSGQEVFDRMLNCARELAAKLDAEVLDENRGALSPQTEAHIREDIALFEARMLARLVLDD